MACYAWEMEPSGKTDFDRIWDRTETDSLKWSRYAGRDIIPMWVADMDFQAPPPVLRALKVRIDHGIFGYTVPTPAVTEAVVNWMKSRHQWMIHPDWIVWLPGLVCGLNVVCRAFSKPGEEIVTNTPIYPPFLSAPLLSGRSLVRCPLTKKDNFYTVDPEQLERAISPRTKVLLFCSPHNPTGRIWTKEEMEAVVQICLQKDCLICSDEIHADLVVERDGKHIPTASLSGEIAARTITLGSPSKTFNLPGLNCAFAIISNQRLRTQFRRTMRGIIPHVNTLGYTACRSAYTECTDWLADLLGYLRINRDLVYETINQLPDLSMGTAQATYLAWIDCRGLGVPNPAAFFEEAGVGLSDGAEFGAPGFVRLNYACPRKRLTEALDRMRKAVSDRAL